MLRRMTPRYQVAAWAAAAMLPVALTVGPLEGSAVARSPAVEASVPPIQPVPAVAETQPVTHSGDAIDDPAIWVNPSDPGQSLVIGDDKKGALVTYDLSGNLVQSITDAGFWGDVDLRQQVEISGQPYDVVGVMHDGIQLYTADSTTLRLRSISDGSLSVYGTGSASMTARPRCTRSPSRVKAWFGSIGSSTATPTGCWRRPGFAASTSAPKPRGASPTTTPARCT